MTKILLAACAALALSGCFTAEEMAAQDSEDCHSYGAATGTGRLFSMPHGQNPAAHRRQRARLSDTQARPRHDSRKPRAAANDADHRHCAGLLTGTSEVHEPHSRRRCHRARLVRAGHHRTGCRVWLFASRSPTIGTSANARAAMALRNSTPASKSTVKQEVRRWRGVDAMGKGSGPVLRGHHRACPARQKHPIPNAPAHANATARKAANLGELKFRLP